MGEPRATAALASFSCNQRDDVALCQCVLDLVQQVLLEELNVKNQLLLLLQAVEEACVKGSWLSLELELGNDRLSCGQPANTPSQKSAP